MSGNTAKWSRKRSSNEEDYDNSSIKEDEKLPKAGDWKVKTLDEIRQEKRRKLDNEYFEVETEGSRLSGKSSSTSSPSLKIESRSSSKRPSPLTPQEIIYQLSPDHSSPLSTESDGSSKKRPMQQKGRRKTAEEEEGEILSDISDVESGTSKQRSRGNSRRTSVDVEMVEKPTAEEEEEEESEEESSDEDSESSEEEVEEETKVEKDISGSTQDKQEETESSEEEESSDTDSDDSEESSEDEEEEDEKNNQTSENKKEETKVENQEDSDDDSEKDSSESDDSDDSDSSEEEEEESPAKDVKQKQNIKTNKDENGEDVNMKSSRTTDSRKEQEKDRKQRDGLEQQSKSRDKYDRHTEEPSKSSSRRRKNYDEVQGQRHSREKPKYSKDSSDDLLSKENKSREKSEEQSKGEKVSSKREKNSRPIKDRNEMIESNRSKGEDRDSYKRKRREGKSSSSKDENRSSKRDSGSKTSNASESRLREASSERKTPREQTVSKILMDQERLQFSTEVVDSESDNPSSDEDSSDSEREKSELNESQENEKEDERPRKLPDYLPGIQGCRNVSEEFVWLNRIEEGTYGVVYRARDKRTNEIVALKRLKMEKEKEGFPITSLREINTLLKGQHPNIVTVREIVVGNNMDRIYIVMDYVEHDLKTLMEHMSSKFSVGEVKSLLVQLLRAVAHLHDNWILHRDLKSSNLLLSNEGILKVGDFGLAREYGSPLRHYTPIVVTLWYRAPELLLGIKEYSCPIDLWSCGCIFAELLTMKPLFPGKSEIDQINRIFKELGTPSDSIWPGPPKYSELPHVKKMTFTEYPYNQLRNNFGTYLTDKGFDLLNRFLTYDPSRRITAEEALKHEYFNESPLPVDPDMFPTWPAKSEMMQRPRRKDYQHSPKPPEGGEMFSKLKDGSDSSSATAAGGGLQGFHMPSSKKGSAAVAGFALKF
ncbi:cyclin-dependent kinase 11B-like [Actinia tenebrosa]|uniref:cyclin-dependent kinase n=1 Tax=Actinia tenebrosa TaxID=6105 RepID=A0A6P8I898_ACTTE|nr:cyclin-dependent kinase 11B-like [Actinia tenebrosa]